MLCNLCCIILYTHTLTFDTLLMLLCCLSPAQSCGPPPTVQHAQVQTTGETYLNNASYVCDAGLQLVGTNTLICLANGTWSLPAPTCEGMEARKIKLIYGVSLSESWISNLHHFLLNVSG